MIVFAGDINLTDWDFNPGFGIGTNITNGFNPFAYLDRKPDDCWVGNFEGVTSSTTNRRGLSSDIFRIDPKYLAALKHFNIYGFSNNHAMQHGGDAYWDTVHSLQSFGCQVFGTSKAHSLLIEHQGQQVTITGMSLRIDQFSDKPEYWHNPEYSEIKKEIDLLPSDAFKILYIHWGNEYINRPSSQQKKFAHWLIEAGFNLIIGMHPHILQGFEDYKSGRIYYSLGNFVFDMASEPCKIGAIVNVEFRDGTPCYSEQYVRIDSSSCPHIVNESEIPANFRFSYLNNRLLIEDNSEEYHLEANKQYKAYRKANHIYILKNIVRHPKSGIRILFDYIKRRI